MTAWQAWLVLNLGYTAHGISIGQIPQILTSALSLCSTVPILYLMARGCGAGCCRCCYQACWPPGVLIAVDQLFGSAVFGALAIVPAVSPTPVRASSWSAHVASSVSPCCSWSSPW